MIDEHTIRDMVRRVVMRTVQATATEPERRRRRLVTQRDVEEVPAGGELEAAPGSIVSPLARQAALERRVKIVEPATGSEVADADPASRKDAGVVALAADHGGYELKERLAGHLREMGYAVIDCGTSGRAAVDYPDYALAAAQLVAQGKAWRAIIVDGAGIGSCMAANKVPGVRAAMCYDEATAVNSREHNHANVLTLGAGLIGPALARQIADTWLETPAATGRHARRVAKIMDIERRYSRK